MFGLKRFSRSGRVVPGTSLVPIPFAIAGATIILLAITLTLDNMFGARFIERHPRISVGDVDDARAILGAVLGAVSTVLALIFSVTLLVFSMAVSQFGPRLMPYFLRDRTMQVTLGLFLATFLHSLATFIATGRRGDSVFVPQLTVLTSIGLVFVSFFYLVVYNNRVAQAIQTNNVLAHIVENLNSAISALSEQSARKGGRQTDPDENVDAIRARCITEGGAVLATTSGYIQKISHEQLIRPVSKRAAVVCFSSTPGQFILEGEVLAHVVPVHERDALTSAINDAVEIGQHRTLEQDIDFAFAQLSEIAIRALSPAINDTYTGLSCIDWLGDALRMLVAYPERDGARRTSDGAIWSLQPPLRATKLARTAFDLIREAGANSPAVTTRLLQTFARLALQVRTEDQRRAIFEQVEAVWQAASHMHHVGLDSVAIEAAYRLAHDRLAASVELPVVQVPAATSASGTLGES
jgi:uncharacterized membrane protein